MTFTNGFGRKDVTTGHAELENGCSFAGRCREASMHHDILICVYRSGRSVNRNSESMRVVPRLTPSSKGGKGRFQGRRVTNGDTWHPFAGAIEQPGEHSAGSQLDEKLTFQFVHHVLHRFSPA